MTVTCEQQVAIRQSVVAVLLFVVLTVTVTPNRQQEQGEEGHYRARVEQNQSNPIMQPGGDRENNEAR